MGYELNIKFNLALESLDDAKFGLENERFKIGVNRAYYAVFYAVKALLFKKGFSPKTHTGTISKFGEEFVLNDTFNRKIAKIFTDLEELREKSDYDDVFNYNEELVLNTIKEAEMFIEEARKFL
ncbi:MAG: HEPN domain-containing protein [Methanobrevibacter sp.]|jgi:uncharacterized protein (UPF0332 family)|nr:HEPN domain-containing protein [Candidatus Methanoflexus mossambicus]